MNTPIDSRKIRADFPILDTLAYGKPLIYLDNAATTQKPRAVLEKTLSYYAEANGNIHRSTHYLSEKASDAYEAARESVRMFINAGSSREIVFTQGTTASINLVAQSFGDLQVHAGDEIVVTEMEHHSNLVPWQMLCKRTGARLKVIPFDDDGKLRTDLLSTFVTNATKLIAAAYVSNVLGVANPLREIIDFAHARDIPVLVDGAQAVQHMPVDVQGLDCDFFAFSGHKMYADTGIGVLYGKKRWLERMPPYQCGGGMIASVDFARTLFAEPPLKFEAGTPHIAGAISLGAAIAYLGAIGMDAIAAHERDLMSYADQALSAVDGVRIYGTAPRCGVLSFNLDSISPFDACMVLDKMGIALRSGTHCAEPVMKHFGIRGMIRASFAVYNTRCEIDAMVQGIKKAQAMLR
jgi:cysteine desulfurase/selenocysteine lyase